MPPARFAQHASAAGAEDQAFLNQVGLDHVFQGIARLGQGGGERLDPNRAAGMVFGDAAQVAAVHRVQAQPINLQPVQRGVGDSAIDRRIALNRGEVAHPAQQAAGDPRCPARTAGDLGGTFPGEVKTEQAGAAGDDLAQFLRGVEHQPQRDAEPVAQRRGQQARPVWSHRPG